MHSLAGLSFQSAARENFNRRRERFAQQFGGPNTGRVSDSGRVVVLLEGGRYRFQARVQTQINQRAVEAEAVSLRSSEGRALRRGGPANGWAALEHEFTLKERDYVDLIYEFGTADGFSALDKSSLKLVRLNPASAP